MEAETLMAEDICYFCLKLFEIFQKSTFVLSLDLNVLGEKKKKKKDERFILFHFILTKFVKFLLCFLEI